MFFRFTGKKEKKKYAAEDCHVQSGQNRLKAVGTMENEIMTSFPH